MLAMSSSKPKLDLSPNIIPKSVGYIWDFHLSLVMQFAVVSILDFYSNYSTSFFILLVIAVYFHSATGLRLTASESSSVEFIKVGGCSALCVA